MFAGIVEHQLDDKKRLRIPSKFRKGLVGENGDKTYCFFRGKDKCICVMEEEKMWDMFESLKDEDFTESNKITRAIFSSVAVAEEDAQGRVMIPLNLRLMAGIQKDVVTLGVGNRLEIWAAERYAKYIEEDFDYDEALGKLRL